MGLPALPMPDLAAILKQVRPEELQAPKARACLSEYEPMYDPELEYRIDDIPIVPFSNKIGEYDSGIAKGSVPQKTSSKYWSKMMRQ